METRIVASDRLAAEQWPDGFGGLTAILIGVWSYRTNADAIVISEVFATKTGAMPKAVIATCRERLKECENAGK